MSDNSEKLLLFWLFRLERIFRKEWQFSIFAKFKQFRMMKSAVFERLTAADFKVEIFSAILLT